MEAVEAETAVSDNLFLCKSVHLKLNFLTLKLHEVFVLSNLVGFLVSDSLEHGKVVECIHQVLDLNTVQSLDAQNFLVQVNDFVTLDLINFIDVLDVVALEPLSNSNNCLD